MVMRWTYEYRRDALYRKDGFMNIGLLLKKSMPTILTFLGAVGLVSTVVLAVKATPKAAACREEARAEKVKTMSDISKEDGEDSEEECYELTTMEVIKAEAPCYIPTILMGCGTLLCIFGANVLNIKQQASLISAYAFADRNFKHYKDRVKSIIGVKEAEMIDRVIEKEILDEEEGRPPWNDIQTFYIDQYGKFFETSMEKVVWAENELNRLFVLQGYATFNDFLKYLELPTMNNKDALGWEAYLGEVNYGYRWIDFYHRHHIIDDGLLICSIEIPFPPHDIEGEWEELEGDDNVRKHQGIEI